MGRKTLKITGLGVRGISTNDVTFAINNTPCQCEEPVEITWGNENELTVSLRNGESESLTLTSIPQNSIVWEEKGISFYLVEI